MVDAFLCVVNSFMWRSYMLLVDNTAGRENGMWNGDPYCTDAMPNGFS